MYYKKIMPELPEVETVVRNLIENDTIGEKIIELEIIDGSIIKNLTNNSFLNKILNASITNIKRNGKWIIFSLDNNFLIVCHLRMTGKILFEKNDKIGNPLLIFHLFSKKKIFFYDSRKFGIFKLEEKEKFNLNIGPDVLSKEFNYNYLFKSFKSKKRNIKSFLMDQKVVAGIGNIYASEILFFCKINPHRLTIEITCEEIKKIIFFSKKIMNDSVRLGGTSIIDFVSPYFKEGKYQNRLRVYSRKGKKCFSCNNKIENVVIEGRSSFFCQNCQK